MRITMDQNLKRWKKDTFSKINHSGVKILLVK